MPVPVSWWVHSLSLYFCIIITSKRITLRRTSCCFWWSLSQLSSFTGLLASSYTPEKVLSHVVSWCDCHGMPYWRHRSEYSRYPDQVWRRLSKRSNSQFREKKKKKRRQKEASFKPNSCWVWTDKCELVLEISYGKRNTSLYDNSQMQHIPANLALHFPAGCGSSLLINLAMICVAERPPCQQGYCLDAVSAHPFDLQCLLQPPAVTSTAHKLKSCQEAVILAGYWSC